MLIVLPAHLHWDKRRLGEESGIWSKGQQRLKQVTGPCVFARYETAQLNPRVYERSPQGRDFPSQAMTLHCMPDQWN
jgi:hypothetical protein